jgi:hypothetical protein
MCGSNCNCSSCGSGCNCPDCNTSNRPGGMNVLKQSPMYLGAKQLKKSPLARFGNGPVRFGGINKRFTGYTR